jgi:invasion protein IalB
MSSPKLFRNALLGALLFVSSGAAAHNAKPFLHEFGELRVYFHDWLVVCDDWGNGPCRAVYYVLGEDGDTSFGESVLRLHRERAGAPTEIEFFDRGAPEPSGLMFIRVDGHEVLSLSPRTDFSAYSTGGSQVMETVQFNNHRNVERMISEMRAGRWMEIDYQRTSDERKQVTISLRGLTASLRFIDRQLASQSR